MRRVVITGIGVYSSIGHNASEVAESLRMGKSGIGMAEERRGMGYRSSLTGILDRPDLKQITDRRQRHNLPEQGEYAVVSTHEAMTMAGLTPDYISGHEVGIIMGGDSSAAPLIEGIDTIRRKGSTTLVGSNSVFQTMTSTVSMNLSVLFKLKGISLTVASACASGSHAIGLAYTLIQSGFQDRIVCGGAQETNKYSVASFDGISAFSTRESEPSKASRPFDKDRDGLVPSGGAASLILESLESATQRGAKILAEVVGYGFSSNADHLSTPSPQGPQTAMEKAIKMADIKIDDIDYINAHATSTLAGDANEAISISNIWKGKTPIISSTKSMTGHELWMSGASELVYSIIMMQNDFIAPNINFCTPDEQSARLNITPCTVNRRVNTVLSNSFGFGGTNSSILIQRFNK